MDSFPCHECREPVEEGSVVWLAPSDGHPDEAAGEPYCPVCAAPQPLAA